MNSWNLKRSRSSVRRTFSSKTKQWDTTLLLQELLLKRNKRSSKREIRRARNQAHRALAPPLVQAQVVANLPPLVEVAPALVQAAARTPCLSKWRPLSSNFRTKITSAEKLQPLLCKTFKKRWAPYRLTVATLTSSVRKIKTCLRKTTHSQTKSLNFRKKAIHILIRT